MTLSSGDRELGGGFERYTFEVSTSYIQHAARIAAGSKAVWDSRVVGWYLFSPRPDTRDIVSVKVGPSSKPGISVVTLILRRGHLLLLHLLRQHGKICVDLASGRVSDPESGDLLSWILPDAFPDYGEMSGLAGPSPLEPST